MNFAEYQREVLSDGEEYILENIDEFDDWDTLYEEMELTITGNDNGSYYCNSAKAEEALAGVTFDSEVAMYLRDYGYEDGLPTEKGPETCDVLVRFAALQAVYSDLENFYEDHK